MRKSTIFISAILTTFTLAMLYGVVSAYRNSLSPASASAIALETATQPPAAEPTQTPAIITPVQAAQLAAEVVGNNNLLSAETTTFNGLDAYLVTFTNSDYVYVSLEGQILGVQVAPVVMNVAPQVRISTNNNRDDDDGSRNDDDDDHEDEDREDGDDHDEHDDDD
jgi:hypothetical protein